MIDTGGAALGGVGYGEGGAQVGGRRKERMSRECLDDNRRTSKKLKGRPARTRLLWSEQRQPEWESPPRALASDLIIVSFSGRSALPRSVATEHHSILPPEFPCPRALLAGTFSS